MRAALPIRKESMWDTLTCKSLASFYKGLMVIECLAWIPHVWDMTFGCPSVRKDGFVLQDLPEEILVDILSRLPGDIVLECRRVCKQWLALTSTPNFVQMHLMRATPVLFVQCVDGNAKKLDMFIYDKGAKANKMIKEMTAELMELEAPHMPCLCGSCDGLLVFHLRSSSSLTIVCNPLTREKLTIRAPAPGIVCGLFFHPHTKDYRLLFVHHSRFYQHVEGEDFQYFLYSFGGQFWKKLDDFPYRPNPLFPPTLLNGALHWIVNPYWVYENELLPCSKSVMMFNMDTEEFSCMPHPGRECMSPIQKEHKYLRIFEMEGKLALCRLYSSLLNLWVLEDYEDWIWVKRYSVDLCLDLFLDVKGYPYFGLDIKNAELLMDWGSRGGCRYKLRQGTVKQINGVGTKQTPLLPYHAFNRLTIPYTKTFVSPSGFKKTRMRNLKYSSLLSFFVVKG